MPRKYSFIYANLVEDENDLIGHIAYSIYKSEKINYIKAESAKGNELSDEDLETFNVVSSTEGSISSYKLRAEILLQNFVNNVLDETIEEVKIDVSSRHKELLKEVVKPLETGFWKNVGINIISSFIFALLLTILALVIKTQGTEINFNINTSPKVEPKADSTTTSIGSTKK
ncbi:MULTISPECIES: hypothetical protein [Emticicia]|uniref:hypothetical protein n=1 Tax=Emticicia TaxID=312278 RepID=UPI0007D8B1F7|nr:MULTISPECIES: hypothetical protein [Emticicia]